MAFIFLRNNDNIIKKLMNIYFKNIWTRIDSIKLEKFFLTEVN